MAFHIDNIIFCYKIPKVAQIVTDRIAFHSIIHGCQTLMRETSPAASLPSSAGRVDYIVFSAE